MIGSNNYYHKFHYHIQILTQFYSIRLYFSICWLFTIGKELSAFLYLVGGGGEYERWIYIEYSLEKKFWARQNFEEFGEVIQPSCNAII